MSGSVSLRLVNLAKLGLVFPVLLGFPLKRFVFGGTHQTSAKLLVFFVDKNGNQPPAINRPQPEYQIDIVEQ